MAILVNVVGIPHHLALLCVTPLRIFAFFCFTGMSVFFVEQPLLIAAVLDFTLNCSIVPVILVFYLIGASTLPDFSLLISHSLLSNSFIMYLLPATTYSEYQSLPHWMADCPPPD